MPVSFATDFDEWIAKTYDRVGSFTMLIVLVAIGETSVALLRSSYLHVIGGETRWPNMAALFAGADVPWNGAAFFQAGREGLVADGLARQRLAELARHLEADRSILKHSAFFDRRGLSLKIEAIGS
jgi:hypothetical protein